MIATRHETRHCGHSSNLPGDRSTFMPPLPWADLSLPTTRVRFSRRRVNRRPDGETVRAGADRIIRHRRAAPDSSFLTAEGPRTSDTAQVDHPGLAFFVPSRTHNSGAEPSRTSVVAALRTAPRRCPRAGAWGICCTYAGVRIVERTTREVDSLLPLDARARRPARSP
jgi:hypothetical protein